MTTRNRASLSVLLASASPVRDVGQALAQDQLQDQVRGAHNTIPAIDDAIEAVCVAAEKTKPFYGHVARATQFIDLDHMTKSQALDMVTALKKAHPHNSDKEIQDGVEEITRDPGLSHALDGTNIVVYRGEQLKDFSPKATNFVIAHEIGHHIRDASASNHPIAAEFGKVIGKSRAGKEESKADHIAAEIISPQNAVDALGELALRHPSGNDKFVQKLLDKNAHTTDYERALKIQKEFPGQPVDIAKIPKPTASLNVITSPPPSPLPPHVAFPPPGP